MLAILAACVEQLRDLYTGDEVLVALAHQVVVLCHSMDLRCLLEALRFKDFGFADLALDEAEQIRVGEADAAIHGENGIQGG